MKDLIVRHKKESNGDKGGEKGQAIVEFAMALPIMLAILCAILDFGWIYANQEKVEYASYTGARYAALNASGAANVSSLIAGTEDKVRSNLSGRDDAADISVSVGEDSVSVTVEYPVKTLTFVAGTIFGAYYNATATSVSTY